MINYTYFCNRWEYFQKHVNMQCGQFFLLLTEPLLAKGSV